MAIRTLKIGIIGVGTVGSATILLLEENKEIIKARTGVEIIVKKGIVRDRSKTDSRITIPLSNNIDDILEDEEIDVVVELMGGIDLAYDVARKALKNKKAFVTANKAMLAYHRYDLQEIANNIPICFEASVAGGIPVIKALRDGLSANHILGIRGILNGTCNYILTKMTDDNTSFEESLKEAQILGYAESDSTFDINGMDAAHKLLILSSIAYGIKALPSDILVEGVYDINQDDISFAKEFGYVIKLLAIAKKSNNEVELRVHPAMIYKNEMISKVSGVMNAVSIIGDKVGETMYYGAGAGGNPTASAVVSDLIEIARNTASPMLGFKKSLESGLRLKEKFKIESRYYLRLKALDAVGTLAKITSVLGDSNISIKILLQKESYNKEYATLLLVTHKSNELDIHKALDSLSELNVILAKPIMIRIEE